MFYNKIIISNNNLINFITCYKFVIRSSVNNCANIFFIFIFCINFLYFFYLLNKIYLFYLLIFDYHQDSLQYIMAFNCLTIIAKTTINSYLIRIKNGPVIDLPYYALLTELKYYFIISYQGKNSKFFSLLSFINGFRLIKHGFIGFSIKCLDSIKISKFYKYLVYSFITNWYFLYNLFWTY